MAPHECTPDCECRTDIDHAAAALERATRLLTAMAFAEPLDLLEKYYAGVKFAEARLAGAMAAYRDHLMEAA